MGIMEESMMMLDLCRVTVRGTTLYGQWRRLDDGETVVAVPTLAEPDRVITVRRADGSTPDDVTEFAPTPVACVLSAPADDGGDDDTATPADVDEDGRYAASPLTHVVDAYRCGDVDGPTAGTMLDRIMGEAGRRA